MSVKFWKMAWDTDINHTSKIVLLALTDHANEKGICWPGLDHLALKTNLTRRSVINQLNKLCEQGLIKKEQKFSDRGQQLGNVYTLLLSNAGERTSEGGEFNSTRGVNFTTHPVDFLDLGVNFITGRVNFTTKVGEYGSPKPSINHHNKQYSYGYSYCHNKKQKNDSVVSLSNIETPHEKSEVTKKRSSKKKNNSEIPHDFHVTQEIKDYAIANGLVDPETEVDQFINHHTMKGTLFKDWTAAFKYWLRNSTKWQKQRQGNQNNGRKNYEGSRSPRKREWWENAEERMQERAREERAGFV